VTEIIDGIDVVTYGEYSSLEPAMQEALQVYAIGRWQSR
jgi:hypothetical protein